MSEKIDLRTVKTVEADVSEPVLLMPKTLGCGGTILTIIIIIVAIYWSDQDTDCGDEDKRPTGVHLHGNWKDYECKNALEAKSVWKYCLKRKQYSKTKGDGCPSNELCCPPPNVVNSNSSPVPETDCGSPYVVPSAKKVTAPWGEYSCQNKASAGKNWPRCLPRKDYSKNKGRGCKMNMMCCPP